MTTKPFNIAIPGDDRGVAMSVADWSGAAIDAYDEEPRPPDGAAVINRPARCRAPACPRHSRIQCFPFKLPSAAL
jgi:hypothetical protein